MGDLDGAQDAAERAIGYSRRSLRANYEAWAHGVLARARLRRDGAAAQQAADAALAQAEARIASNGIDLLAPAVCEWRAELAGVLGDADERARLLEEARRGYTAIGAPKRAERVADA